MGKLGFLQARISGRSPGKLPTGNFCNHPAGIWEHLLLFNDFTSHENLFCLKTVHLFVSTRNRSHGEALIMFMFLITTKCQTVWPKLFSISLFCSVNIYLIHISHKKFTYLPPFYLSSKEVTKLRWSFHWWSLYFFMSRSTLWDILL